MKVKITKGPNFVEQRPPRSTAKNRGCYWPSRKRLIKQGKSVGRKGGRVTHTGGK